MMLPLAPFALDFLPHSRTSSMVRLPLTSGDVEKPGQHVSDEDIASGLVDDHIQFLKRRRLCMFLMTATGGGELTLLPKDSDAPSVALPIVAGRLVVFRHGRMSYAYSPQAATDLVLQAWVLTAPEQLKILRVEGDQRSKDEMYGLLSGPNTPEGPCVNVFGIGLNLPGDSHGSEHNFWAACVAGTDGQVKVPYARFDIDEYCRVGDDWQLGYSYTCHGGFVGQDIYAFDNEFFNVPKEEAFILAPASRQLLEKGYEALFNSGFRKKDLRGRRIGVYIGHSGDDWAMPCGPTMGSDDCHKYGAQARQWSCIAGRLCFALGLKGPQALLDTACSSALVAYGVGHTALRRCQAFQSNCGADSGLSEALMAGANLMPGPGNYINLSGPHMLSAAGRCFTFNATADGFERGEGASAFFVRSQDMDSREARAAVIGACMNQDGRSASMTAPNGPSQQECIRGSMREACLEANQVTCGELHGTGTALGDPIEVGALRGVMQNRNIPMLQTSAKSLIGHLEANAGQAGMIKCMLMCSACAGTPNCHLQVLNPHLDVNGYPTIFDTEICDYGNQSGYSGVSSFGFGGANARADIFAAASRGARKTGALDLEKVDYVTLSCPFDEGPMHHIDGREVPLAASSRYQRGRYRANAIRDEFASYDYNSSLYDGQYQLRPPTAEQSCDEAPTEPIFIVGSWDAFQEAREMQPVDGDRTWTALVQLGETRCERFQLRVGNDKLRAIYPAVRNGSTRTRVVGPHHQGEGLYWMLDGRDEEVPAGSMFRLTFGWGLSVFQITVCCDLLVVFTVACCCFVVVCCDL
ncbi:unnamed protein product [Polarella glacialis]|uniref:Ketosynthase family 3 (KS3) domain-containing protein n=1 Tax=Polarella glacialis TaxID=89957 RepID=A0A813L314_POLGL|nr:unnamed protein product [Polarella glacialis]